MNSMAELMVSMKHMIGKNDLTLLSLLHMKRANGTPVSTMRKNEAKFINQYKLPLSLEVVKEIIIKKTNYTGLAIVHIVLNIFASTSTIFKIRVVTDINV